MAMEGMTSSERSNRKRGSGSVSTRLRLELLSSVQRLKYSGSAQSSHPSHHVCIAKKKPRPVPDALDVCLCYYVFPSHSFHPKPSQAITRRQPVNQTQAQTPVLTG